MRSILKFVPQRLKLFAAATLSRLRRFAIGKKIGALLVESDDCLLLVGVEDMQVGRKVSFEGAYAAAELKRLLTLVNNQSDVLVVGGHVGALAIPLAKACRSLAVLEPNPDTYRLLELNVAINKCGNVQTLNLAAGDQREELSFLASRANSGGSKRLPLLRDYRYFYDRPDVISVPAVPLDEVFPDSVFDLVVMDIEGSEYFALKGMQRLLANAQTLAIEFIPHHLTNVAGVSVSQFVEQLDPFFDQLFIPSQNRTVQKTDFDVVLTRMFDAGELDEGLIFFKESRTATLPITS